MHPETLRQYEMMVANLGPQFLIDQLVGPHHFHLSYAIFDVAKQVMVAEAMAAQRDRHEWDFPESGRLPASSIVLSLDRPENGLVQGGVYVLHQTGNEVCAFVVQEGFASHIGSYFPGTSSFGRSASGSDQWNWLMHLAFMVSLINEPRIVESSPAKGLDWSRQHRKAVVRVTGKAAMAFSVVRWKIGKHQKAIGTHLSEEGHPKPLHWCRAHWRRAEEGQPKAEWVNIPRKGGWGWYCWAADCWKGHPDFGVKLQRHEPYLEGEPRSRFVGSGRVLDSTRFAAMGAAHRAAMVEAGFAPSRSLH